jgi:coenzyme F420-reducing hydrogenase alpha subunit/coenzyme F420-reducing hydrogenase gamma subunit
MSKPTLAVWKFASCDGCQLTLLDCEDELLDFSQTVSIAYFLEASSAMRPGPYDISLVEGSITTQADAERIRDIRAQSRRLVTIGACATAGGIQALRNFGDVAEFASVVYASPQYIGTLATSTPISAHVPVDFELRGCPIDRRQLLEVITALLAGRKPDIPDTSVCTECKRRGLTCVMVAHGTPCLGPVTHAGCGALCPAHSRGCYGCFGPMTGANVPALAVLRRLIYCGEWISSHALHIYLLHAPDFLGYPDAISFAAGHRAVVERGLELKKTGNAVLELIGGRAIHPVNLRLGGFYSVPTRRDLAPLAERLRAALDLALDTVRWAATFDFPDLELEHDLLALHEPGRYPIERGDVRSASGLSFAPAEFPAHVTEQQVPHSTALHATLDGRRYLAGPLARYSLNSGSLSPVARQAADEVGLGAQCRNPFRSILVRGVEIVYAVEEALRIIDGYERPDRPAVEVPPRAGTGHGVSEAPRGLLYHRYELDAEGLIRSATIIPPTSQSQGAIEDDLRRLVEANLDRDDASLTALCEQAIRNHDPCISCSAHFLTLTVQRR